MSRNTGSVWKKSRRLGFSVLETGEELTRRNTIPGQHGNARRPKLTNYGIQLQEKQRICHTYQLSEKQFYNTYLKASKKAGSAGENFLVMLESRLDNIVYRMGFARTRRASRQLVNHGHVLVDGKKVDIPSFQVKPGQVIEIRERAKNLSVITRKKRIDRFFFCGCVFLIHVFYLLINVENQLFQLQSHSLDIPCHPSGIYANEYDH